MILLALYHYTVILEIFENLFHVIV